MNDRVGYNISDPIDSKELRNGNWVLISYVEEYKARIVEKSNFGGPGFKIMPLGGTKYGNPIDVAESIVFPIPLTEKILEKCGFEYNYFEGYAYQLQLPDGYGLQFTAPNFDKVDYDGKWIDCKYLHQFQNLYFSLTGTELEYEP